MIISYKNICNLNKQPKHKQVTSTAGRTAVDRNPAPPLNFGSVWANCPFPRFFSAFVLFAEKTSTSVLEGESFLWRTLPIHGEAIICKGSFKYHLGTCSGSLFPGAINHLSPILSVLCGGGKEMKKFRFVPGDGAEQKQSFGETCVPRFADCHTSVSLPRSRSRLGPVAEVTHR